MIKIKGKCLVRKEGSGWVASCFINKEPMKIVRSKNFDEIRDYAKSKNLSLEVVEKYGVEKDKIFELE